MQSSLSRLRPIFGYLVALACLVWVFHDVRLEDFLGHALKLNWWWVLGAVILDVLSYVCQGARWRLLLRHVVDISIVRATQAIYAGLFLSEVLPMRVGEIARGYLVAYWTGARFTSVLPSIVIERVFDGIWLAIGIGLTAMFVPLPRNLLRAGDVFGVAVLAVVVAFLFIVFSRKPNRFTAGIREIGRTRLAYEAFGVSAFILIIQSCAFWMVMQAYGINLSIWIAAAVLIIIHLGTAIPNAPANVGTYSVLLRSGSDAVRSGKIPGSQFFCGDLRASDDPVMGNRFLCVDPQRPDIQRPQRRSAPSHRRTSVRAYLVCQFSGLADLKSAIANRR